MHACMPSSVIPGARPLFELLVHALEMAENLVYEKNDTC